MIPFARRLARLLPLILILGPLRAADDVPRTDSTEAVPATTVDPMRIQGIFNTDLPRTERKSSVRFIIHPHFGDFTNRQYLRVPVGLRWGATEQLELSAQVEAYLSHGLRGGSSFGSDAGFSGVGAGAKYRWAEWLKPYFDTATGINFAQPIGTPPLDVTDGLRHITPYITFAHALESRPDMTVFVGVTQDFVSHTNVQGQRRKNEFDESSWAVTPGFVWHRGPLHYTLEVSYASSAFVADDNVTMLTVRPAVSWDLPRALTFNSKGRWVFGLGLRATHGPDGMDYGISGKFRGEFNLKRMLGLAPRREDSARSDRK